VIRSLFFEHARAWRAAFFCLLQILPTGKGLGGFSVFSRERCLSPAAQNHVIFNIQL